MCAGAHADDSTAAASGPEIVAARELFRQGTEDVDAGRFAPALEKFRRVAAVKETANVRFNIARCEEALNRTGAALADFETAEREAAGDPRGDAIGKLARERATALRPRVPRLGLSAPVPVPAGLSVTLDGARIAVTTLGIPLPVDPGLHVIDATAPGRDPFHASITLIESESKTLTLTLPDPLNAPAPAPAPAAVDPASSGETSAPPPPSSSAAEQPVTSRPAGSGGRAAWGVATLVGGGLLGAGSILTLLIHNGAVHTIRQDCPDTAACPQAERSDVESQESKAHLTEGLSIGLLAGAVVAGGLGAWLVLTPGGAPASTGALVAPGAPGAPAGVTVLGRF